MKKRIRKKKSSKAIEKYGSRFIGLIEPILQFAEEIDPTEFRTHEEKLRESAEKEFASINQEEFAEDFLKLLSNIDMTTAAKQIKKNLGKEIKERNEEDPRFNELYRLVKDTDKKFPNIGCFIFLMSNPKEAFVKSLEPFDLIQEFENLKGEKAARAAIRIYREVAELLYADYLKAIVSFVQLLEGETEIKTNQKFGSLTFHLPGKLKKLGYNDLVDNDAGWMRNATCHGHWKYDVKTGKLTLWDNNRPEREFTPPELFERAMMMYSMFVINYMQAGFIYLKEKVVYDWLELFKYVQMNLSKLLAGDKKKNEYVEKELEKAFGYMREIEFK